MAIGKEGNVKWVDGLRGLASFLVVLTHIARGFDPELFGPAVSENGPARFLQWPYVRVLVQGRIGVAIFSMVTGYVCALKPIKLIRQGNREAALMSLTKSSLRRIPRLVLPTTIATLIIWVLCMLGAFEIAKHSGPGWTANTSPTRYGTVYKNVEHLVKEIIHTWTRNTNEYDPNQWTLLPLLKGSMIVYVFIVATSTLASRFRMMAALCMWFYYFLSNDAAFGMMFFWGVFLSELQNTPSANDFLTARPIISRVICVSSMVFGLCIASFPEGNTEWAAWSNNMRIIFDYILPKGADYSRFSTALGLQFIAVGLHCSPLLRDLLSNRWFLWLGKQSFAVYLLHGTIPRTVLCYMLFGLKVPEDHQNEEGNMVATHFDQPTGLQLLICTAFWLPLNYVAAYGWTTYVDPWCARVTEKLVGYVKEEDEQIIAVERK
ncbi:hypothetical protein jhhlp_008262 [Lomentospora prolificans]|uniref:Acyltransferase 3 domain-containing protein n=1 Tax=Lomentospora prolificans TaxID=41688 RepID=A0A2N3MXJ6_9PEZI|nr:hypothetical protein jhhlp_008262 [Lomentospora prolificans]